MDRKWKTTAVAKDHGFERRTILVWKGPLGNPPTGPHCVCVKQVQCGKLAFLQGNRALLGVQESPKRDDDN